MANNIQADDHYLGWLLWLDGQPALNGKESTMTNGTRGIGDAGGTQAPIYRPQVNDQQSVAGAAASENLSRPRYTTRRLLCGIWGALGTAICGISALISLFGGHFLQFLGAAAITVLIGRYDYRIWTFKAKWLMFLIIF